MNIESMQVKGQLVVARKKLKTLETEASGLIILVRFLLNPYEEDICKLEIDKAGSSMQRLQKVVSEMKIQKARIEKLEAHFD